MEVENQHLREMMEQKENHYQTLLGKMQIIINNLEERITEQANTIRDNANTIRAFISRMME